MLPPPDSFVISDRSYLRHASGRFHPAPAKLPGLVLDSTVIGEDHAEDAKCFKVTAEGVVLVCPHMLKD